MSGELPEAQPPRSYVVPRASDSFSIDCDLAKPAWEAAPWTEDFVDIEGDLKPRPPLRTRAKMLWDQDRFCLAFEIPASDVGAVVGADRGEPRALSAEDEDSFIMNRNAFVKLCVDPDGDGVNYFEFHINALNNVNDVALDAEGNVYFTDPKWGAKEGDTQGVYCYHTSGSLSLAAPVEKQPNGLVVSPDQKWLYVGRSGGHDIWRFAKNPDGTLGEGEIFAQLESDAEPDGMTVDTLDRLFVATSLGLQVFDTEDRFSGVIESPVRGEGPSNATFAGPNFDYIYVTMPNSLYRLKTATTGVPYFLRDYEEMERERLRQN